MKAKLIRPEVPAEVTITMSESEAQALLAFVGSIGSNEYRDVRNQALPDALRHLPTWAQASADNALADLPYSALWGALTRAGVKL